MTTGLDLTREVVDVIHGIPVADPFRWLEVRDSDETIDWIADQERRFNDYFELCGNLEWFRRRLNQLVDRETIDQVGSVKDQYFYRKRRRGEQQPSIVTADRRRRSERVLVNPSQWGPYASVKIHRVSSDGTLLAFERKDGGEHTKAIHVVNVDTGKILVDHLPRGSSRGFVFQKSLSGFYYCHDAVESGGIDSQEHTIFYHAFGADRHDDVPLLRLPRRGTSKIVLDGDGSILSALYLHEIGDHAVVDYYRASQENEANWACICRDAPSPFRPFLHGGRLYAHSSKGATNGKIIELDVQTANPIRTIVPEFHAPLLQIVLTPKFMYTSHLVQTRTEVYIWTIDGNLEGKMPLAPECSWSLFPRYSNEETEVYLQCESFTMPPTVFEWNTERSEATVWGMPAPLTDPGSLVIRTEQFEAMDGTTVSMTIVSSEEAIPGEARPTIMTAYGGFGLSLTPRYSPFVTIMLELGFIFAVPGIRGGGESGRGWHEAARGRNRQVSFDDFIGASEWLISNGISKPRQLVPFGGSNAGILVGAVITQRPDLFGAALCLATLLDMVRYHLFDRARIWSDEYGTSECLDEFRALLAYSPYHHIAEDVNYPSVLFVCGDQDTRCNPAHTRKTAARLQSRPAQTNTILVDHSRERGHAPTLPLDVRVQALVRRVAFLCNELGVRIPEES